MSSIEQETPQPLVEDLDCRQDEVLVQLDQLNRQIENLIQLCTQTRQQPSDQILAAE